MADFAATKERAGGQEREGVEAGRGYKNTKRASRVAWDWDWAWAVTKTLKTHNLVSGSVGISGLRLNSKYILT